MGILRGPKIIPASKFKKTPATPDKEGTSNRVVKNFNSGTMASNKKNPDASAGVVTESKT
jgi:hypothetical protein